MSSNLRSPDNGHSRYLVVNRPLIRAHLRERGGPHGIYAALNSLATPVVLSVSKCSESNESPPRYVRALSSACIANER